MKIRDRLALIFTLATGILLLVLSLFVYYFSATFREREFFNRLSERLLITEQLFLEEENLSENVFQEIREKFLHTLPEEVEIVLPRDPEGIAEIKSADFPAVFVDELLRQGESQFEVKNRQGIGKIYATKRGEFIVIVAATDKFGASTLRYLQRILWLGGFLSLIVVVIISSLATRRALLPIDTKIKKAREISASNLHLRLEVFNEHDEIGELATTFNELLDRLETAFQMQKQFISNASHEIKNPLTSIIGEAEVVLEKPRSPEEYVQVLKNISREADRLDAMVANLLHLAKTGFDEKLLRNDLLRMDELILEVVESLAFKNPESKILLDLENLPEDSSQLEYSGNKSLLRIAISNLIDNACKFSSNMPVSVRIHCTYTQICIEVEDQGIGIPDQELTYVVQPFYRAPNARSFSGSGIGLSLADRIIEMHGGILELVKRIPNGTIARVYFSF